MQRVSQCESVVFCGAGGQPAWLAAGKTSLFIQYLIRREGLPLPLKVPTLLKKNKPPGSITRGPARKSIQRALLQAEIKGDSYPHLDGFAGLDAGGEF